MPANVPAPPERPFRLGEGARDVPAQAAADTVELAAASRSPAVTRASLPDAEPEASPVSAYAPVRYDARAGFMSGRGLY